MSDSHVEKTLQTLSQTYPDLRYQADEHADTSDLLKQVSNGELAFTVASSVEISLAQRLHPDIAIAFEISEEQPVSWFIRRSDDESLYALMIEFFGQLKQGCLLYTSDAADDCWSV